MSRPCVRSYKLFIVGLNMCLSCTVTEIFSVEYWHDLEIWDRRHSRSLKIAPIDRSYTTYYWSAIVTMVVSCTVFEIKRHLFT